jgi:hypothetical protein
MPAPNDTSDDDNHAEGDRRASRVLVVLAGIAFVVVLVASFLQGAPSHVPDIGLGWPVLLYVLRAAVVAYLIMGLGGLGYRLWRGDQVQQSQAPGGPGVGLEEAVKPTEALKQGVDEDIRGLSERVTEVERKTRHLKPDGT